MPQVRRSKSKSADVLHHFMPVVETRGPAAAGTLLKPVLSLFATMVYCHWPPLDRMKHTARWLRRHDRLRQG